MNIKLIICYTIQLFLPYIAFSSTRQEWLDLCRSRLEVLRKSDITIIIKDHNDQSLSGIPIQIRFNKPTYDWGILTPNYRQFNNAQYMEKILALKPTIMTSENYLKDRAWSGEWGAEFSPWYSLSLFRWMKTQGKVP